MSTTGAPGQALLASGRLIVGRGVTVREVEAEPAHPFWSLTVTEKVRLVVALRAREGAVCPSPQRKVRVPVLPLTVGVRVTDCPSQAAGCRGRATARVFEGLTVVVPCAEQLLPSVTLSWKVLAVLTATWMEGALLPLLQA